ncbi:YfiT family bacillithiol transferase [Aestuariivivens sediminicola]|uniref:YfiT family bacillithiol transferase n=1 Tax=Aestuariivivens sediminicola TaxID=2913560 RepID=UPI001F563094|nr:putative metal-dependent hydrolase [Aestuariivivens sediminicola]
MTKDELESLRYPIGKFRAPDEITADVVSEWIAILEQFPYRLESLVRFLNKTQLETPYRPGGWTVRQVIHHLSDSHHHSYIRFKWALTEDRPVIKPYDEKFWAELPDASTGPIAMSIEHLKAVHYKLVYMLKRINKTQWNNVFIHPDTNSEISLKLNVGIYAWHSNHHYAHIENLLKRKGWN